MRRSAVVSISLEPTAVDERGFGDDGSEDGDPENEEGFSGAAVVGVNEDCIDDVAAIESTEAGGMTSDARTSRSGALGGRGGGGGGR